MERVHRPTEALILASSGNVHTAIVCPPGVYGTGTGPVKTQSYTIPFFVQDSKTLGAPFHIGEGRNTSTWSHIQDLTRLYLVLVESAASGGGTAEWGDKVCILLARVA